MTPILSATLLRTQSDARLVTLATDGHERAFEAIVERYRRPLHRYCRRLLPESRAEDVVQQTFLKAWSALQGGSKIADLRPWLYRIAHNATLDAVRKAGYDYDELTEALELAPGADADLERRAVMRETLAGVAALPESQREALLRTAIEGHSRADIARDLGVSEGAVRQLVHRARSTLRAAATVMTPLPLAGWASAATRGSEPATQRIAELAAGVGTAGTAGATGVILKTGTVLVAAGVLAVGPGKQLEHTLVDHGNGGRPSAAEAASPSDGQTTTGGARSAGGSALGHDGSVRGRRGTKGGGGAGHGDRSRAAHRTEEQRRGGGGDRRNGGDGQLGAGDGGHGSSGDGGHGGGDVSHREGSSGRGGDGSGNSSGSGDTSRSPDSGGDHGSAPSGDAGDGSTTGSDSGGLIGSGNATGGLLGGGHDGSGSGGSDGSGSSGSDSSLGSDSSGRGSSRSGSPDEPH